MDASEEKSPERRATNLDTRKEAGLLVPRPARCVFIIANCDAFVLYYHTTTRVILTWLS